MYVLMLDSHIPLYEGSLMEYCVNQKAVLYWCKFYNSNVFAVDDKERPPDRIIEYDILLDDWLERKLNQRKIKKPAREAQEVIEF